MVRFKKRYLLIEIVQLNTQYLFTKEDLMQSIKKSIQHNFGDYGSAVLLSNLQSIFIFCNITKKLKKITSQVF